MDRPSGSSSASGADRNAHAARLWTTRCHDCHDKRTAGIWLEGSEALYRNWPADLHQQETHEFEIDVRKFANIGNV